MNIDYLRYFDCLARVLNYTKAANELFITQPALSAAIKRMEKETGLTLFARDQGSSRVLLTEEGEVFHEYIVQTLKNYDAGLRIAHERRGEVNAVLRVGTLYAIQGRMWSQAMQKFRETC